MCVVDRENIDCMCITISSNRHGPTEIIATILALKLNSLDSRFRGPGYWESHPQARKGTYTPMIIGLAFLRMDHFMLCAIFSIKDKSLFLPVDTATESYSRSHHLKQIYQ